MRLAYQRVPWTLLQLLTALQVAAWAQGSQESRVEERSTSRQVDRLGDPLPEGASGKLGTGRLRHHPSVTALAVSPDGKLLASAGVDAVIRLWDSQTGREVGTRAGHVGPVLDVVFSEDESVVYSVGMDGTLRLWNLKTATDSQVLVRNEAPLSRVALGADRQQLVVTGPRDRIQIVSRSTPADVRSVTVGPSLVSSGLLLDAGRLVTTGDAGVMKLWSAVDGKLLKELPVSSGTLAYSSERRTVAGVSQGNVVLWDRDGQLMASLGGHSSPVLALDFSKDGRSLASADTSGGVRIWDLERKAEAASFQWSGEEIVAVRFSPCGSRLFAGSSSGHITWWSLNVASQPFDFERHSGRVTAMTLSPDGQQAATGSQDTSIRLWNMKTQECVRILKGHANGVLSIAYSPNQRYVASSAGDCSLRIWETLSGREVARFRLADSNIRFIRYSRDGGLIAGAADDGKIHLWRTEGNPAPTALVGDASDLAFSSDGTRAAVALRDGNVAFWRPGEPQLTGRFMAHPGGVSSVVFLPSSNDFVISGGQDGKICIWEASGKSLGEVRAHTRAIPYLHVSNDGGTILSASQGVAKLHETWTLTEARDLRVGAPDVDTFALATGSNRVLAGGSDGTATVYDITEAMPVAPLGERGTMEAWDRLASVDPIVARGAVLGLAASGNMAILAGQVVAAPKGIEELCARLDSESIEARDTAERELIELGWEPELEVVRRSTLLSEETKARVERILLRVRGPLPRSKRALQRWRAVQAIEMHGGEVARRALQAIADLSQTSLGAHAAAAIKRLEAGGDR